MKVVEERRDAPVEPITCTAPFRKVGVYVPPFQVPATQRVVSRLGPSKVSRKAPSRPTAPSPSGVASVPLVPTQAAWKSARVVCTTSLGGGTGVLVAGTGVLVEVGVLVDGADVLVEIGVLVDGADVLVNVGVLVDGADVLVEIGVLVDVGVLVDGADVLVEIGVLVDVGVFVDGADILVEIGVLVDGADVLVEIGVLVDEAGWPRLRVSDVTSGVRLVSEVPRLSRYWTKRFGLAIWVPVVVVVQVPQVRPSADVRTSTLRLVPTGVVVIQLAVVQVLPRFASRAQEVKVPLAA